MTSLTQGTSAKAQLVVILGMHRSGTSTVARSMPVMNVELGNSFLPPDPHNEKGYWEDSDIQALNVEMLQAIDSDWHHLASITKADVFALQNLGYARRVSQTLCHKLENTKIFGLKDPRITKLLPFWKEVFKSCDIEVRYVLVIRNPLSIVKSLQERDDLNRIHCYYLWLEYNLAALDIGVGRLHAVIDYDRLIQSPTEELQKVAAHLDLPFDRAKMGVFQTEFLDPKLRHSVFESDELSMDTSCPELVREIYFNLLSVSEGRLRLNDNYLQDKISSWTIELESWQTLFVYADNLFRQVRYKRNFPSLSESLYNVGRSVFLKVPVSAWLKKKLR